MCEIARQTQCNAKHKQHTHTHKNVNRFDESTQAMYRSIEKLLGADFWKHVIVVATRVDSKRDMEKFENPKKFNFCYIFLKK